MVLKELEAINATPEKVWWEVAEGDFDRRNISYFLQIKGHIFRKSMPQEYLEDKDGLALLIFDFITPLISEVKSEKILCESCGHILEKIGHILKGNPPTNNLYAACINRSCSEYAKEVDITKEVIERRLRKKIK